MTFETKFHHHTLLLIENFNKVVYFDNTAFIHSDNSHVLSTLIVNHNPKLDNQLGPTELPDYQIYGSVLYVLKLSSSSNKQNYINLIHQSLALVPLFTKQRMPFSDPL